MTGVQTCALPIWVNAPQWKKGITVPNCGSGFASEHPDGSNFLMCDGSVQFITDQIEHKAGVKSTAYSWASAAYDFEPFFCRTGVRQGDPGVGGGIVQPPGVYQLLSVRDDGWPLPKGAF